MDNNSLKHFYDALSAARAIQTFIVNKTFEDYLEDELLSAGVERKFEIIGDGARPARRWSMHSVGPKGVSSAGAHWAPKSQALNRILKESPNDLQAITNYRGIIDFRNVVAHAYDHLEDTLVWGLASNQLDQLISELEAIDGIEP
jgi:uncharacterized protein with HEPN domain